MPRQAARSTRFEARIPPIALRMIKRAAEIQGRSVSEFVVAAAEAAASETIRNTHVIEVALDHQEAFFKAMVNPPLPGPALRRAAKAHARLIKKSV